MTLVDRLLAMLNITIPTQEELDAYIDEIAKGLSR